MLTRLENILTFQRYEKWKVGEKLGSKAHPCYIGIRVITNRVISRFKCIRARKEGWPPPSHAVPKIHASHPHWPLWPLGYVKPLPYYQSARREGVFGDNSG